MGGGEDMEEQTKRQRVREYLLEGRPLSGLEALRMFGVYRLSHIIHLLRNNGFIVHTTRKGHENYAVYTVVCNDCKIGGQPLIELRDGGAVCEECEKRRTKGYVH